MIGQNTYGRKNVKDLLSWDPRPKKFRQTSEQQRIDFVTNVSHFDDHTVRYFPHLEIEAFSNRDVPVFQYRLPYI